MCGEITFTPTSYLDAGITINNKAVNSGSESTPIRIKIWRKTHCN